MDYFTAQLPVDSKMNLDSTMPKDKYEPPNERRQHRIMQKHEVAEGKQSKWSELEISGFVQNLSLNLWKVEWLTVLYLDNNHLSHLPSHIGSLVNLEHLDASHNYIHQLPPEIGELVNLRELKLGSNRIQDLPCELGKCFQLQTLDLSNNPLNFDINKYYTESVTKLLCALLDSLSSVISSLASVQYRTLPMLSVRGEAKKPMSAKLDMSVGI